jgi:hypothetical protein
VLTTRKRSTSTAMGHFDPNDPSIKREIVHLILQYLQDEC